MRKTSDLPNSIADSTDFPFGRIKDESGEILGTPVIEATYGDIVQNMWHFVSKAGITPNGLADSKTTGYQLVKAIEKCVQPLGTIIFYPSTSNIPLGFDKMNGMEIDLSNLNAAKLYSDLFAIIGYTYGGSGSKFNLPDTRGRAFFDLKSGYTLNEKKGSDGIFLTVNQLPEHSHRIIQNLYYPSTSGTPSHIAIGDSAIANSLSITTQTEGQGEPIDNMPPAIFMQALMKTHYVANL